MKLPPPHLRIPVATAYVRVELWRPTSHQLLVLNIIMVNARYLLLLAAAGSSSFPGVGAFVLCSMRVSISSSGSSSSSSIRMAKDDALTEEERQIKLDKALKAMTAFSNKYIEKSGTRYCTDKSVPAVVIKGLAEHKVALGAPLCPCRFYDDKEKEVKDGYWNCPCVPMRERKECHCMLFLTEDNAFVGEDTVRYPTLVL